MSNSASMHNLHEEQSKSPLSDDLLQRKTPCLRSELIYRPQREGQRKFYLIENPLLEKFYRLGLREYAFLCQCNGQRSIGDALDQANCEIRHLSKPQTHEPLSEQEVAATLAFLVGNNLLNIEPTSPNLHAPDQRPSQPNTLFADLSRVILFRVPLGSPRRWISRISPRIGWLFGPVSLLLLGVLWMILLPGLAGIGPLLKNAAAEIVSLQGPLIFLACWIAMKGVHELAHAVTCHRYGGEVGEVGCLMILFAPIPYVDVSSSWRFRSRWQRIHTAAAGIQAELMVTTLAILICWATPPGMIQQTAARLVLVGGVNTLLFNANPLMRFDGYYILSDLLSIPNLYGQAANAFRQTAKRWISGRENVLTNLTTAGSHRKLILFYGITTALWRVFALTSLALAATAMWGGVGMVLAGVALVSWFLLPLFRMAQFLFLPDEQGERIPQWRVATAGAAALGLLTLFALVPCPINGTFAGMVECSNQATLRAKSSGFVDQVCVAPGTIVGEGQLLIVLQDDDLTNALRDKKLQLQIARAEARILESHHELAKRREHEHKIERLEAELAEFERKHANLRIVATQAGTISGRRLANLVGSYVEEGEKLGTILDPLAHHVRVLVPIEVRESLETNIGTQARIDTASSKTTGGILDRFDPRASDDCLFPALAASHGGTLTVRNIRHEDSASRGTEIKLVEPHFTATIVPENRSVGQLSPGQRAFVTFEDYSPSLLAATFHQIQRWIASTSKNES